MNFIQSIPFNTNKGGTTPKLCLANVTAGYGIANKYGSAWEAWGHTQQHTDHNVPTGVDVPIYYSYTTTIDGVTQNYGHINVHLKNGTVWSDGNIYASIDDYTSKKLPKFVGWGESVNDFKVIKQGVTMARFPNEGDLQNNYSRTGWPGHPPNANDVAYWTKGTNNPTWAKGSDYVFAAFWDATSKYVAAHPQIADFTEVGIIDSKPVYRKA